MTIRLNDLSRRVAPLRDQLMAVSSRVVERGWFVLGPEVRSFERSFAEWTGCAECVGVASGTDALELALRACGAGPGKTVVTVANAGGYGTTAILAARATPLFVDVDPATLLMDPASLTTVLQTQRPVAILVTHLYGRMADLPQLLEIASAKGIPVVEDCAQAHGASLDGKAAGAWGVFGCFSFYPTKNLGCLGDGGAITVAGNDGAQLLRQLRQYGWDRKYRNAAEGGRNSRLDELQAGFLSECLPLVHAWNDRRRFIARKYSDAFGKLGLQLPPTAGEQEYVAHLYVLRTSKREQFRECLHARGVETDVHYPIPDHWQIAWRDQPWADRKLPATEQACREVVTLPCFPELTDEEVEQVITAVQAACRDCSL